MMLSNAITTKGPVIPQSLIGIIDFKSTCVLMDREISAFNSALIALSKAIDSDRAVHPDDSVTVILCDSDSVSFDFDEPTVLGNHISLIFCYLHRWRTRNLNALQMITCILEEFCHHFWKIRDENLVQYKVLSMLLLSAWLSLSCFHSSD